MVGGTLAGSAMALVCGVVVDVLAAPALVAVEV
jgi:hypothetical protein